MNIKYKNYIIAFVAATMIIAISPLAMAETTPASTLPSTSTSTDHTDSKAIPSVNAGGESQMTVVDEGGNLAIVDKATAEKIARDKAKQQKTQPTPPTIEHPVVLPVPALHPNAATPPVAPPAAPNHP
ncbi:MAG TPA: hypothetical protein VHZ76_07715 [Gammaproteobacteria bacterium]|jgi:hypothetical protein|nr:hypothetical protein [Gammaproteobacteria bacterium]